MLLKFELTMPNCGSWNGVDTGNKKGCYIFSNVKKEQVYKILNGKETVSHYYNFGD